MRGCGQQGVRPARGAFLVGGMKLRVGDTKNARIAADLVQRNQPVVDIKTGILHALRHHRAGELLHVHGENAHAALIGLALALTQRGEHGGTHKIKHTQVGGLSAFTRFDNGGLNVMLINFRNRLLGDVGSIHRKTGHHLHQGIAQTVQGEIAGVARSLRNAPQLIDQHIQLACERDFHNEFFGAIKNIAEAQILADERGVGFSEQRLAARVDEQPIHQIGKVVAGGAVNGPVRQVFIVRENFFDQQIKGFGARFRARFQALRQPLLHASEILARVIQAIRMIDAQRMNLALGDKLENQTVRGFKYFRAAHAQTRQLVHIEKSPVINIVRRHPPARQMKGLRFNQFMQRIEARRDPGPAIDFTHDVLDEHLDGRMAGADLGQPPFIKFLVSFALGDFFRMRVLLFRQMAKRGEQGLQFGISGGVLFLQRRGQSVATI